MSNKYLGPADRRLIAEKWAAYASVREIAALVGVAPKTIYQELRRGSKPLQPLSLDSTTTALLKETIKFISRLERSRTN